MNKTLSIIVIVILVALGLYIGYTLALKSNDLKTQPDQQSDQFAGWKTYQNEDYGFGVKYPEKIILTGGLSKGEKIILAKEFTPADPYIFSGRIGSNDLPGLSIVGFMIKNKPSDFVSLNTYLIKAKAECQEGFAGSAAGGVCNIEKALIGGKEILTLVSQDLSAMINKNVSLYFEKGSYLLVLEYGYSQGQLEIVKQLTPTQENEDWALIANDEEMLYKLKQQILSTFKFIK